MALTDGGAGGGFVLMVASKEAVAEEYAVVKEYEPPVPPSQGYFIGISTNNGAWY